MRQSYLTITFNDGEVREIHCTESLVRDKLLVIYEPRDDKGDAEWNTNQYIPLTSIKSWKDKTYQ